MPADDAAIGASAQRKASLRLLPLIGIGYGLAYMDRVNISFASLRMNSDLHLSATVYGFGAGLFFIGYAVCEVPSNLLMLRVGARRWLARIMFTWGLLAMAVKPRSSVVNYLLSDLIPIGTLDHAETTALRKKMTTSSWADSLLTALLSKTGEQLVDRDRDPTMPNDEPDLLFVRKFVLENILKAYKDASTSSEPLDIKSALMLSLADLMNHIMQSKKLHRLQQTLRCACAIATDDQFSGLPASSPSSTGHESGRLSALCGPSRTGRPPPDRTSGPGTSPSRPG